MSSWPAPHLPPAFSLTPSLPSATPGDEVLPAFQSLTEPGFQVCVQVRRVSPLSHPLVLLEKLILIKKVSGPISAFLLAPP